MYIKTLILKDKNKRVTVSLRERKTTEQLQAIESITKHLNMPVKQIRYK